MEIWFAIATGVVSGIVSAGLLFVARTLVAGHLLPWYHDLVYRGINIDGEWHASSFQMLQDIRINIKQRAGAIHGDAQFSRRDEEQQDDLEDTRAFDVEGRIQDRYITLTFSHKNRQRLGVVSMLLEPICDGRQLQGIMSFVSIKNNNLDSIHILFARDSSIVIDGREHTEQEMRAYVAEQLHQPELPLSKPKRQRKGKSKANDSGNDDLDKITIE